MIETEHHNRDAQINTETEKKNHRKLYIKKTKYYLLQERIHDGDELLAFQISSKN